jgi:DNA processing protein
MAASPRWRVNAHEAAFPLAAEPPRAAGRTPSTPWPPWLEVEGACTNEPSVAVVGARGPSRPNLAFARELALRLATRGLVIVSGGARGIDAAAHEGALAAGGRTIAVMGSGLDRPYPPEHAPLFRRIVAGGGALVSPFESDTEPRRSYFPKRNEVIAGWAQAVVVVEAALVSGSLSTAAAARRRQRPVFAVVGSPGCDSLVATGRATALYDDDMDGAVAAVVGEPREVRVGSKAANAHPMESTPPWLTHWLPRAGGATPPAGESSGATPRQGRITAALVAQHHGWPLARAIGELERATLDGWLRREPGGQFTVSRQRLAIAPSAALDSEPHVPKDNHSEQARS